MHKNVFCKNTKLSEDEFLEVLYSFFLLESATACASKIGRSRQSVLALFSKIGNRIGRQLNASFFPNFSTDLAYQMFVDEPDIRKMLSEFIRPQQLKLILRRKLEIRHEVKHFDRKNSVLVERLFRDNFYVSVYNGSGDYVFGGEAPAATVCFFQSLFHKNKLQNLNRSSVFSEKVIAIMGFAQNHSDTIKRYIPDLCYADYLEYKEDDIAMHEESCLPEHGIYRMLNLLRQTEKKLRGFSSSQFNSYSNRARLIELMFVMCRDRTCLSFNERVGLAKKSAYCFMAFSLRLNPL